jgi:hypothetical protein
MDAHLAAYFRNHLAYDEVTGIATWLTGRRAGDAVDGRTHKGYVSIHIAGHNRPLHRVIWTMVTGESPSLQIDHIDGVRDNNRMDNLRLANSIQNNRNKLAFRSNTTTGLKGVTKRMGRYSARIHIGPELRHLGTFATMDEAAHAYNKAAIAEFGEFAVLNPIGLVQEITGHDLKIEVVGADQGAIMSRGHHEPQVFASEAQQHGFAFPMDALEHVWFRPIPNKYDPNKTCRFVPAVPESRGSFPATYVRLLREAGSR